MEMKILAEAGQGDKRAWAFGLGLERLAMVLFDVPVGIYQSCFTCTFLVFYRTASAWSAPTLFVVLVLLTFGQIIAIHLTFRQITKFRPYYMLCEVLYLVRNTDQVLGMQTIVAFVPRPFGSSPISLTPRMVVRPRCSAGKCST
jgi:hypothetical protein